ncbi:hypothetical protein [Sphingobacterium multivorum]|uniref:Uncharacterized protein n=1 Tax=Sphingobacterium multivorum TaxID=28454 RepID=A0A653YQ77_SPHMU|nr:hypothetical protein [Sphingobacterium multivorum]VXC44761.1 hypothetical protein SPHINGO8BC_110254 [Sphingobacterium multivorum]
MKGNLLIIKSQDLAVTILKSELLDFFNQVQNLDVESIEDLTTELEDVIDDIVKTYADEKKAKGLKKRIQLLRMMIDFIKTVELTK